MATKVNKDSPERWRVLDAWTDARDYGALVGVFNLKEDAKVNQAFLENKLDYVRTATKKRLKACGVTKPKFKKAKRVGLAAMNEKGTMADASRIYLEKLYGKPKKDRSPKKSKVKKSTPKPDKKVEPVERKPLVSNPNLPQSKAYVVARKELKKGEILSYIRLKRTTKLYFYFIATYRNKKTKKKRETEIKIPVPKLQLVKKAKPKKSNNNGSTEKPKGKVKKRT